MLGTLKTKTTMAQPMHTAAAVWKTLNGILCLHKPPGEKLGRLLHNVKVISCAGLNELKGRPPRKLVWIETPFSDSDYKKPWTKMITTDYSDHPLVIGPRYRSEDIHLYTQSKLGFNTSGVCVIGINRGKRLAHELAVSKPMRVYRVMGELGQATDTYFSDGRIVERATFSHVRRENIDKIVASMQASHQRAMFEQTGVHLQSQAAYELAAGGLHRPADDHIPVVYKLHCVAFSSPFFTLEVACVNETEDYLLEMVHTIGIRAHTVAKCIRIQCIRYGPFFLDHALVRPKWNVVEFSSNIQLCTSIAEEDRMSSRHQSPYLMAVKRNADNTVQHAEGHGLAGANDIP